MLGGKILAKCLRMSDMLQLVVVPEISQPQIEDQTDENDDAKQPEW
jgi:hypothetical protein